MTNREQFLLDRRTGIGGSDIAAIVGLTKFRTPLDVYLSKVSNEEPAQSKKDVVLKRGNHWEKRVFEEYCLYNDGVELETNLETVKDKEYSFLIGNVDAKVKDKNILVEAKTVNGYPSLWKGEIPNYYKVQAAHYASITDCDYVDFAVLFNFDYKQFTYYRDKELESEIRKAAIDFWHNHVLKNEPPAPAKEEDTKRLYPNSNLSALEANDDLRSLISKLIWREQDNKDNDALISSLKVQIKSAMQEHQAITWQSKKLVTWKNSTRKSFDTEAFEKQYPELYKQFLKVTKTRRFTVC